MSLVVSGQFISIAGDKFVNNIASYDPVSETWEPLGLGLGEGQTVWALQPLADGSLVVAGAINFAGGLPVQNMARWDGVAWSSLGTGLSAWVNDLAQLPNGDLIAGTDAGVLKWDGASWTLLGGMPNGRVYSLHVLPNGDLLAGGGFTALGQTPANYIARWNGTAWSAVGNGVSGGSPSVPGVHEITSLPNGDIVVAGDFYFPASGMARWDGLQWSAVGASTTSVFHMMSLPNGDIVAVRGGQLQRWDGGSWSSMGEFGAATPLAVLPTGDLIARGTIGSPVSPNAGLIRWNGTAWSAFGVRGLTRGLAVTLDMDNRPVLGGWFTSDDLTTMVGRVVRREGNGWLPIGDSFNAGVESVRNVGPSQFIATGIFTQVGQLTVNGIAHWDGTAWQPLGQGFDNGVYATAVLPSGQLVAGGSFSRSGSSNMSYVARWDGSSWQPVGAGLRGSSVNGGVFALLVLPNGDLIAGGTFTASGTVPINSIARWNGSTWEGLGSGGPTGGTSGRRVRALALDRFGDVLVGGHFTAVGGVSANNVARWNGSTWSRLGAGTDYTVLTLGTLSNGDVIAGGSFRRAGGRDVFNIARWDGAVWNSIGGGTASTDGGVISVAIAPNDDMYMAGDFRQAGTSVSGYFAHWGLPAGCCDSIDFNNNTVFPEDQDVIDFFSVLSGATCATCNDIDFNNNTVFPEDQDVIDFFTVLAGGSCP